MAGTGSISKICVLTNQVVLWVLIKNHHYFLDFWNSPLMSNWILHFPGGCGEKIIENNFCWSSAKSTLNISNTIWTNNVLLILKVRKVFFYLDKTRPFQEDQDFFEPQIVLSRGRKSRCLSRKTPRNGQIFVLPAYKTITLQNFGISETLVFMFLCDHITYIFCFFVFLLFLVILIMFGSWSMQQYFYRPQPVILSSTNNVEKSQ